MLSPIWSRYRLRATYSNRHSAGVPTRYVRLHAERLEDRYMMSGNDPTSPGGGQNPDDALTAESVTIPLAAADSATNAIVVSASDSNTAAPWQRFQSTAEFEAWLVEAAVAQWSHLFGQGSYYADGWDLDRPISGISDGFFRIQPTFMTTGALNSNSYSTTNVQVAGVDEADFVETDGKYLYVVSGQDLVIIRAGEGDELQITARVRLDGQVVGMYLSGDRLAIISSQGTSNSQTGLGGIRVFPLLAIDAVTVQHSKPTTTVTVLDISDRSTPTLVQKTEMDGQLVASRVVDGQLRIVLGNQFKLPRPIARLVETEAAQKHYLMPGGEPFVGEILAFQPADLLMADMAWWGWSNEQYVYETQDEYITRVREEVLAAIRPQIRSLAADGSIISESPLFEAADLYRPESIHDQFLTTVATFDLNSNDAGPVATANILTAGAAHTQVYMTADSVYVFAERSPISQTFGDVWNWNATVATTVWKFDVDAEDHDIDLAAKGTFEGALLNQFSADEHDGHLRVVTKNDWWGNPGQGVRVLRQVGAELSVIGSINGIAQNEELYSVRFMGDRAFFVTFRKVDPLYAVDLSDPANPQLLGELHIPGFSDYLQPIDDNRLLAIGRGADEMTGLFEELQVSIFDISDLTNPELLHRYSFEGGRDIATPATGDRWTRGDGDHHAVSYFETEQIFALPIYSAGDWWNGAENAPLFEAGHGGLQVFQIDVDAGFTPIGLIEHDTLVHRSVRIGDRLFAISSGSVTVHDINDPTIQLGELSIASDAAAAPAELRRFAELVWASPVTEAPTLTTISQFTSEERPAGGAQQASNLWSTWALPNVRQSDHAPRIRAVSSPWMSGVSTVDADLVQLLALDITSRELQSASGSNNRAMLDGKASSMMFDDDQPSGRAGQARTPLDTALVPQLAAAMQFDVG